MFVLSEIDIKEGCEDLEGVFNPVGHPTVKVFGEDVRESGIEFRLVGPRSVEFKDTAAEIGREGEIDEGDLVFEVHLAYIKEELKNIRFEFIILYLFGLLLVREIKYYVGIYPALQIVGFPVLIIVDLHHRLGGIEVVGFVIIRELHCSVWGLILFLDTFSIRFGFHGKSMKLI